MSETAINIDDLDLGPTVPVLFRTCIRCGVRKPSGYFLFDSRAINGQTNVCSECRYKRNSNRKSNEPHINEKGQLCCTCKERKPFSEFGKDRSTNNGIDRRCKRCKRELHTRWRNENRDEYKDRLRVNHLKNRFGLTREQFTSIMEAQDDKCAICRKEFASAADTCVDHDHITEAVRGILCRKCNTGIGLFRDDINLVRSAVAYLQSFGEGHGSS